jgi:hypothetical protein
MRNRSKIVFNGLVAALALFALQADAANAQALDATGTWTLTVDSETGVATPTLTLQQDGQNLTGHYSSAALGEHDVTGTVTGRSVRVNFNAEIEGLGEAPLSYIGSVSAEGVWSGELSADFQGQAFPIGTFTATKS